ncbi:hypothetical protein RUND412_008191 [Rhizina undulata]
MRIRSVLDYNSSTYDEGANFTTSPEYFTTNPECGGAQDDKRLCLIHRSIPLSHDPQPETHILIAMSSAPSTPAKSAMSEPGTPKTYRDLPLLTPRSKVKAMLAELSEDDSEEEGDVLSKSKNIRPSTTESSKPTKEAPLFIGSESEDELESDKEPVRPRGRLANRMMARESDSKKTGGSAYERVKASIFGGGEGEKEAAKETSKITNQLKDSDTQEGEDEDDEDEDIPIAPRRKRPLRKLLSPPRALSNSPASSPKSSGSNAPAPANEDSEDELPENLFKNARFQALVEKKRQERREKEEQRKQKALEERWRKLDAQLGCGSSSEDEDSGAEKLTQRAPRRKAGKKAIEEMHRETQRMARSRFSIATNWKKWEETDR